MGFYDFRCPVSGLSLRAARAVHVALIETKRGRWSPLGLPIVGTYDRLGTIDGLTPDPRTDLLVAGFARMAAAGRVDGSGAPDEFAAFTASPDIDGLLRLFERVNTMSRWAPMQFTLDGLPLRQVLLHADVFAAVAPPPRPPPVPDGPALAQQLARAPVAGQLRELFGPAVEGPDATRSAVGVALAQLTAFSTWQGEHGKRWSPRADTGQYGPREDLRFARAARTKLAHTPELAPVLARLIAGFEHELAAH